MERIEYSWERLPEVIASQEYSRCLGRLFASLPRRVARKSIEPLTRAAVRLGAGIVACNLDVPPGEEDLPPEDQAEFRRDAMEALQESRRAIQRFRRRRHGDPDEIARALELLDRTEMWMNAPTSGSTAAFN